LGHSGSVSGMIDIKICDCVASEYERVYKKAPLEHVKTR